MIQDGRNNNESIRDRDLDPRWSLLDDLESPEVPGARSLRSAPGLRDRDRALLIVRSTLLWVALVKRRARAKIPVFPVEIGESILSVLLQWPRVAWSRVFLGALSQGSLPSSLAQ